MGHETTPLIYLNGDSKSSRLAPPNGYYSRLLIYSELDKFSRKLWRRPPDEDALHVTQESRNLMNEMRKQKLIPNGTGLPVFIGPGFTKERADYAVMEKLFTDSNYKVVIPNFTAKSPNMATAADFDKFEEALLAIEGKVLAIGHSNGAIVLRALAHLHPDKFDTLVTLAGPMIGPTDMIFNHIHPKLYKALMINSVMQWCGMGFKWREGSAILESYKKIDPRINLLSFAADDDSIVDSAKCVDIRSPQAENIVVSGGHLSIVYHPEVYKRLGPALEGYVARQHHAAAA